MPSVVVSDFKYGLDRRRPRAAAPPGTLWTLNNALISRGGDLERSKKWVPAYTLPAGTFGLSNINGQLTVFGSANLAGSMPVGVQYQRLDPGTNMVRLLKVTVFGGLYYVIAEYNDGNIHHWYNAVLMTAWDALSDANSSQATLAAYLATKIDGDAAVHATASGSDILITADVPGSPFTATAAVAGPSAITITTLQANVPAVAEVRSSSTLTITSGVTGTLTALTAGVTPLIAAPVPFLTDLDVTANAVAVEINNNTSSSAYQAIVVGNVITILAATGTGATPNGTAVTATVAGAFGATTTAFAGGVTAVTPVAQVVRATLGGTYQTNSTYTITIAASVTTNYFATGRASGYGTDAFTYKQRIYFPAGNLLRYCALSDPTIMTGGLPASGPGFISVANDSEGNDPMLCLAPYQIYVALFSRRSIRIYDLQSDATLTNFRNPLQNTGTFAPHSVMAYGNTDVFYFDDTGIRSIQSRDVINTPYVGDVGSPIDTLVHDWYTTVGETISSRSCSAIEPLDGRFMIAVGSNIFTLSYFPNSKVTAWSIQQPGFIATDFTASKRQLYARSTVAIAPAPPPVLTTTFLTSGTTWNVPSDWNNASNSVTAIGGGGGGAAGKSATLAGAGGAGGAWATKSNITLTPGGTVNIQIGGGGSGGATDGASGGNGTDTIFDTGANTVVAKAGTGAIGGSTQGHGGAAASCTPAAGAHSGGDGGGGGSVFVQEGSGGGGGGAGGPNGAGAAGGHGADANAASGGAGGGASDGGGAGVAPVLGANTGGVGGAAFDSTAGGTAGFNTAVGGPGSHGSGGGGGGGNGGGGAGGAGIGYTSGAAVAGPGGGGGSGGANITTATLAGPGGLYGGGGAGGKSYVGVAPNSWSPGSAGAPGLIIIAYTPAAGGGGGGGGGGTNDIIYLYGGLNGTTYADANELTTTIETSFVSAQSPDKVKAWTEFSAACQNVWDIYLLVDPDDDTKTIHIGKVHGNTYDLTTIAAVGEFPYVAVRAICTAAGNASLSNMTLGYAVDEE